MTVTTCRSWSHCTPRRSTRCRPQSPRCARCAAWQPCSSQVLLPVLLMQHHSYAVSWQHRLLASERSSPAHGTQAGHFSVYLGGGLLIASLQHQCFSRMHLSAGCRVAGAAGAGRRQGAAGRGGAGAPGGGGAPGKHRRGRQRSAAAGRASRAWQGATRRGEGLGWSPHPQEALRPCRLSSKLPSCQTAGCTCTFMPEEVVLFHKQGHPCRRCPRVRKPCCFPGSAHVRTGRSCAAR